MKNISEEYYDDINKEVDYTDIYDDSEYSEYDSPLESSSPNVYDEYEDLVLSSNDDYEAYDYVYSDLNVDSALIGANGEIIAPSFWNQLKDLYKWIFIPKPEVRYVGETPIACMNRMAVKHNKLKAIAYNELAFSESDKMSRRRRRGVSKKAINKNAKWHQYQVKNAENQNWVDNFLIYNQGQGQDIPLDYDPILSSSAIIQNAYQVPITFKINMTNLNQTNDKTIYKIIDKAFKIWEQETDFRFMPVEIDEVAEIVVRFSEYKFIEKEDGSLQVKEPKEFMQVPGYTYPPVAKMPRLLGNRYINDIVFNANIDWTFAYEPEDTNLHAESVTATDFTTTKKIKQNILPAAVHEVGHALGLDHAPFLDSVMHQDYNKVNSRSTQQGNHVKLSDFDKDLIKCYYGIKRPWVYRNWILLVMIFSLVFLMTVYSILEYFRVIPRNDNFKTFKARINKSFKNIGNSMRISFRLQSTRKLDANGQNNNIRENSLIQARNRVERRRPPSSYSDEDYQDKLDKRKSKVTFLADNRNSVFVTIDESKEESCEEQVFIKDHVNESSL